MSARLRPQALLTTREVASRFRVHAATVAKWADRGHIRCIRTLGGHRRYRRADIDALIDGRPPAATGPAEQQDAWRPPLRR